VALGSGIRAFFEGPEADIPASWSRDTDFDSIFMQGAPSGENPGASGGGSHSHNESGHFHIHAKHTHPLTVSGDSNLARNTPGYPPEISVSPVVHGHEDTNTLEGGENGESTSIIFDSTEAEPEFIELIVIKPDDENQELPSGVIGFAVNEQIIDLDFEIYTPASGYYIKGAVSTSGGLFGGEEEHSHDNDPHTHTPILHNHPDSPFGNPAGFSVKCQLVPPTGLYSLAKHIPHHMAINISYESPPIASGSVVVENTSNELAYTKIIPVRNIGQTRTPPLIILPFVGNIEDIPDGWSLCDGSGLLPNLCNRFIKCTSNWSEACDSGGSNEHTHNVSDSEHEGTPHDHDFNVQNYNNANDGSGAATASAGGHGHLGTELESQSENIAPAAIGLSGTVDHRPSYKTVLWIQKNGIQELNASNDLFINGCTEIISLSESIDLFVYGYDEAVISGDLFIHGYFDTSGQIPLYIYSYSTSSGDISLYLAGHQSGYDDISLFMHGYENVSGNVPLFIDGYNTVSGDIPLYINGCDFAFGDFSLFIYGNAELSDNIDLFINGYSESSGQISLYICGYSIASDDIQLYLAGHQSGYNDIPLFINGHNNVSGDIILFIGGYNITYGDISLYINGYLDSSGNIPLYINGYDSVSDDFDLFINGYNTKSGNIPLYIDGYDNISGTITLFIEGATISQIISGSCDLFIQSYNSHSGIINLFINGHESFNNNIDLFIDGIGNQSGSCTLFIHGYSSHDNNIILFIDGNEFISGSVPLVIIGSGLAFYSGVLTLFINGSEPIGPTVCPTLDPTASIQIPSSIIDIYQNRVDSLLNQVGKNVLLQFDPNISSCPNCVFDSIRGRSSGKYKAGGPSPFIYGRKCPYCKGHGVLKEEVELCIKCLISWNPSEILKFGISVQKDSEIVKLKTLVDNAADIKRAKIAIIDRQIIDIVKYQARLIKGPYPLGLRKDRYCISFWRTI